MLHWNKPSDSREVWGAADLETAFLLTRGEFFQFLPASHCSGATTQRTTSLQLQNPSLLISFSLIHTDMALRAKEPEGTTLVILAWRVKKTSWELRCGSRNSVWQEALGHTHSVTPHRSDGQQGGNVLSNYIFTGSFKDFLLPVVVNMWCVTVYLCFTVFFVLIML